MNIGSRLKQILEERNLNVSGFSREAGVPAQTLYAMIKRDSNKADMDIMVKILEALDMDLLEFMEMEPRKRKAGTKGEKAKRREEPGAQKADEESKEPEPKADVTLKEAREEPRESEMERRYRRQEMEDYLL